MEINNTVKYIKTHYTHKSVYDSNENINSIKYSFTVDEGREFQNLLKELTLAPLCPNRTKFATHVLCNRHLTFDLQGGVLPVTTLRRQWIYGIFWELMWFLNGRTDLEYLWDKNIHIWDKNYEKAKLQLKLSENDVGKIYGYQWRNFGGSFDQIKYITNELKTNPNSRRIMISGWCPPQIFDDACLPPCHVSYNFNVVGKKLYCQILQRSSDVALALSWNIVSGALLTHMLANTCDLEAAGLSITIANAHIYENHIPAVREMLQRNPRQFPRISFNTKRTDIWDYVYDDLVIYNYDPYPNLYIGEMAV